MRNAGAHPILLCSPTTHLVLRAAFAEPFLPPPGAWLLPQLRKNRSESIEQKSPANALIYWILRIRPSSTPRFNNSNFRALELGAFSNLKN